MDGVGGGREGLFEDASWGASWRDEGLLLFVCWISKKGGKHVHTIEARVGGNGMCVSCGLWTLLLEFGRLMTTDDS